MRLKFLYVTIVPFVAASSCFAQDYCTYPKDKNSYYEGCFNSSNVVAIPADVIAAILQSEEGKEGLESLADSERAHPEKFFKARSLSLDRDKEQDFIVLGSGPFTGADNSWFWIVRQTPSATKSVLWIGAINVAVLKRRTHGLDDIESDWCSAAVCTTRRYKFGGAKYVAAWSKTSKQRP